MLAAAAVCLFVITIFRKLSLHPSFAADVNLTPHDFFSKSFYHKIVIFLDAVTSLGRERAIERVELI